MGTEDFTEEGTFGLVEFPWWRCGGIPDKEKGTALAQKDDMAWYVCVAKAGVHE